MEDEGGLHARYTGEFHNEILGLKDETTEASKRLRDSAVGRLLELNASFLIHATEGVSSPWTVFPPSFVTPCAPRCCSDVAGCKGQYGEASRNGGENDA